MKIVFVSNYLSHHQIPFCDAISAIQDIEYFFVSTDVMSLERRNLGYRDIEKSYEIRTYNNAEALNRAKEIINDADVVILGSAPDSYIIPRLKAGKLTFKYAERFYKRGLSYKNLLHAIAGAWLHHGRFQKYPLYMLCASAYTAGDAAVFHNYIGRTYKWGYFPEAKEYDVDDLMSRKLSVTSGWKHPDVSIELAASLKEKGYSFRMSIIGNGEMEQKLRTMIEQKDLTDCVEMLGAMSPEEVRSHMEKADIYLFTSDFNEGWGAVLNESMNSGCAVIASHAIGSVPFLIQDGENGLIYENGNQQQFEERVESVIKDSEYRKRLGVNAYESVVNEWSADIAAKRFVALSQSLLKKEPADNLFAKGPCSRAVILKNDWYSC